MKMRTILLLITLSLFFSACRDKQPQIPKSTYVKTKVPRLLVLSRVPAYEIKDFSSLDAKYYKVNKVELHGASEASQKRIHKIDIYERQAIKFNKEFVDKRGK